MGNAAEDFDEETDYTEGQDDTPAPDPEPKPAESGDSADPADPPEPKEGDEPADPKEGEEGEEGKAPKVEFTPEQQEVFNDRAAKQATKTAKARQEAETERQKSAQLEQELAKYTQPQRPVLPEKPNEYDDDYEAKAETYNDTLKEQMRFDARQEVLEGLKAEQAQRQQWEAQQRQVETANAYRERVTKLGVDKDLLAEAGPAVAAAISAHTDPNQPSMVLEYIMQDELGPLITEYLYKNPDELQSIVDVSPVRAGELMAQIKEKAKASRTKVIADPKPLDNPDGIGLGEPNDDDKWGTYE